MDQPQANAHIQLPFQKSHAFIVGINDYQHLSRLTTAINDASVLARRLESQHAYTVHEPLLDAGKEELMKYLLMDEHSPFARALFNALDGDADIVSPGKGNGVITASELYAYLRDLVEEESTEKAIRQTPSIFSLNRHDKGEFIFLSPRHRLNLPPAPNRNPYMGLSSYN